MRKGPEMSQPPAQDSDAFIDYGALRALVVDDSPVMRNALRLTLSNFGITKIQMVANAAEAIFQIKNRSYDFILCDFNLGEGRDGQHLLEEHEAAEEELRDVLERAPGMVAAYDLLSDVCLEKKDVAAAQEALEKGVAISAKPVRRQQKLGEVAYGNDELDTARSAVDNVLEKGRHSIFVTPADFGNLCRVQLEQGDLEAVADTLKKNKSTLQANPEGQLVMAVTQSIAHTRTGNLSEAAKALDAVASLRADGTRGDAQLMLDLAGACMANGRHEEADAVVAEVARNAHDSEALLAKAKRLYDEAGWTEAGASVLATATGDVRKLNNEGVVLAQRGDYKTAVEKLLTACNEAPYNPRILMNAVWVILKYIDQVGMDDTMIEAARTQLREAERQAPGHPRLAGLRLQMKDVESRFGIQRKAAR